MRGLRNTADRMFCTMDNPQIEFDEVKYIESLSSMTNTNIEEWDLSKFMRDGKMIKNRGEINKIFFTEKGDIVRTTFGDDVNKWIAKKSQYFPQETKESILEKISGKQSRIFSRNREINQYLCDLRELQKSLCIINRGHDHSFKQSMENLSNSSYWQYTRHTEEYLILESTKDIEMSHVDSVKGINQHFNFGKMVVHIGPRYQSFRVGLAALNKGIHIIDKYFHPHINEEGNICWGTASEMVTKHIVSGQIDKIMPLLWALLHTYNPESPYVKLSTFIEVKHNREIWQNPYKFLQEAEIKNISEYYEIGLDEKIPSNIIKLSEQCHIFEQYGSREASLYIRTMEAWFSGVRWLKDHHYDYESKSFTKESPFYCQNEGENENEDEDACAECGYEECECVYEE